jgi:hypothetical protein
MQKYNKFFHFKDENEMCLKKLTETKIMKKLKKIIKSVDTKYISIL